VAQRIDPTATGSHGGRHRSATASLGPAEHHPSKQHAAPRRYRHLPVIVALVAAGVVAALVLSGVFSALSSQVLGPRRSDDGAPRTGPGQRTGDTGAGAVSAPSTPPGDRPSTSTSPAPGAVSAVRARSIVVRLLGTKALRVHERLIPGDATLRLDLTLAQSSGLLPGFDPAVRRLRIGSPGQAARAVEPVVSGGSRAVPVPAGATALFLDYTLSGVVVDTEPSVVGRALAWLTPLQVGTVEDWSVTVRTDQVLNLGCSRPGAPLRSCGRRTGTQWSVADSTPERDSVPVVVAQLDLAGGNPRGEGLTQ
jgi:hypothetical protein